MDEAACREAAHLHREDRSLLRRGASLRCAVIQTEKTSFVGQNVDVERRKRQKKGGGAPTASRWIDAVQVQPGR